ncbi:uncharacterized protein RSE6_07036 [Rhynchosporium secalis]|uniref:Pentatricopeptide repeat protein n=1 Tax=Rhynchosporium secalis TaxID=38038 RepID=A0A1E1MC19_RHYSE|nr:uncharacterized protein RSE6_07036 [Rhynchosporium secalis]
MPTSLPVPSKGALRALRQLALGTSCTVAIGAGLLTEDRRRRIHSAREVHENAKRLKSSRQYHSTGTASLEALENQASRYRDEAFWLPSKVSKSTTPAAQDSPSLSHPTTVRVPQGVEQSSALEIDGNHENLALPRKIARIPSLEAHRAVKIERIDEVTQRMRRSQERQKSLTVKLIQLLDKDPLDVDGAANLFLNEFEEKLTVDKSGLLPELIEVSARVAVACQRFSMHATSSRMLDTILSYGPVAEEDFNKFQPHEIINQWISMKGKTNFIEIDSDDLKKACSLYLTKFLEKPIFMSETMRLIGKRLCQATLEQGMSILTLALFFRMEETRAGNPLTSVDCLIKATHSLGRHKKVIRHFQQLYNQTTPDQMQFYQVTSLAIDSALVTGRLEDAEKILTTASAMAKAGGLELSTTWFLRILGEEYRAHRDLLRLQDLFRRLQLLSSHMHHPQALYGAIIQFCIEGHQEELATLYYKELRESYERSPEDLRIYGHFALAKAYRGDWNGVKVAFDDMRHSVHEYREEFSSAFAPVLKEFAKLHSVDAIEDFMQYFILELHLKMTPLILNFMIDIYSKVHEVDAIFRWIAYAAADGCKLNSKIFNAILRNCSDRFRFNYDDVYGMYRRAHSLQPDLVNNDSLSILRRMALSRSPNEEVRLARLQNLKRLDDPVQVEGCNEIYRAMSITYAQCNDSAVLKIYNGAERDHVRLQTRHLALAVRASLRLGEGDLAETAEIIRDARANGIEVTDAVASVFIHQISDLYAAGGRSACGRTENLLKRAEEAIASLAASGLEISQMAITHTANILQKRGRSQLAINFWDLMSRRFNIPASSFDLVTLTTLLNAYIGHQDGDGVRWVMQTLSANNLLPDAHLKRVLKEARNQAGERLRRNPYSEWLHRWLDVLDRAHTDVKEMRQQTFITNKQIKRKVLDIMAAAVEDQASEETAWKSWKSDEGMEPGQSDDEVRSVHMSQTDTAWKDVDRETSPVPSQLA